MGVREQRLSFVSMWPKILTVEVVLVTLVGLVITEETEFEASVFEYPCVK